MKKASASLCRRLRHFFLEKPTSATVAMASTGGNNLQKLVDQFKKKSSSSHFRAQRLIYKTTVLRLAKAGQLSSIHEILDLQKQYPDINDEHFTARLICLYGEAKMLDHALKLFDEMPDLNCPRTVVSFNALMAACFPSKNFEKAIELFQELPGKLSIKPNMISYTNMIEALCKLGSLDAAISMLDDMENNNVEPNAIAFNTLMTAFNKNGRFSEAENLWSSMEKKNVIPDLRCYNSRLNGIMLTKNITEALEIFKELEKKELKPNNYTYNLFIKWFAHEGNLEEAKEWHAKMVESGCDPDFITYMTLIPFARDNNDIDFALELCKKCVGRKNKLASRVLENVIKELTEKSDVDKAKELDNSKSGLLLDNLSPSMDDSGS